MLTSDVKRHFPLRSQEDVLQLFRKQLQLPEPNLALLSIVSGYLEHTLISASDIDQLNTFPVIDWDFVDGLYKKFVNILAVVVQETKQQQPPAAVVGKGTKSKQSAAAATTPPPLATRELIKRVSDLIWNSLIRSTYKDRAHLQSLFSYLTFNKLDCFGVAFAVVAGCQLLGYCDVNLAISEDHAWVVFGPATHRQTIEVTWHGKGFEDKRGESVTVGVDSNSWLYLAGHPVVCDRYMEVAALVLAINPSLNLTSACLEVTELQKRLLWTLYDNGHLERYPNGLGNLGELEEFAPTTENRPGSEQLYQEAVKSARRWYQNRHVYPYTYQGSYYYRRVMYREAFAAWANAGDVIRRYIYSRDDEEVYKELLDIANEQIPSIMKTESSGHSARSILRDPNCFASLLRFYDGICCWEEGSLTPILHIGWAKPLVTTIGKFDYDIRSQVQITAASDDEPIPEVEGEPEEEKQRPPKDEANNNTIRASNNCNQGSPLDTLRALTAACGEKLLNPNFLTGGEVQPFKTDGESVAGEAKKRDEGTSGTTGEAEKEAVKAVVDNDDDDEPKRPEIRLYSQKMKGLRHLLRGEKLNTQAILLQMTAQSQVGKMGGNSGNTGGGAAAEGEVTNSGRPKRARRE